LVAVALAVLVAEVAAPTALTLFSVPSHQQAGVAGVVPTIHRPKMGHLEALVAVQHLNPVAAQVVLGLLVKAMTGAVALTVHLIMVLVAGAAQVL
jgi:hypothetical protein